MNVFRLVIIFSLFSLGAAVAQEWTPADLESKKSQSVRIDCCENKEESLVLAQVVRRGRPVYLVSLYAGSFAYRTALVTQEFFKDFYQKFQAFYSKVKGSEVADKDCEQTISLSVNIHKTKNVEQAVCIEKINPTDKSTLSTWLSLIRAHLGS